MTRKPNRDSKTVLGVATIWQIFGYLAREKNLLPVFYSAWVKNIWKNYNKYDLFPVYVASVSPARNAEADYVAWGHSLVVDPFAKVVAKSEADEDIIYADIDIQNLEERRNQIPVQKQRREELYGVQRKS